MTRALVLRAPGINCDRETAYACRLVGFDSELVHINQLLKHPEHLLDYDFLVLPGGFSYGDDLGAGTLLAKNLTIHLGQQLHRFIDEGRPVLGICNGFQVLVRAGLLAGDISTTTPIAASLTSNLLGQFECRWVTLSVAPGPCVFTRGVTHSIELPVAHGEGQFVLAEEPLAGLQAHGQIPLVYSTGIYPANPNGSVGNVAGVCNARGNVLGLMPHPERYVRVLQHPQRRGTPDGLLIFKNAYDYATRLKQMHEGPASSEYHSGETRATTAVPGSSSYAESGVDISAADRAKQLMQGAVLAAQGKQVLAGMGAFAGVFDASELQRMRQPALVASTDGVGTKTLIAAKAGRFDTIGYDLVNHSINDLLTQGARPLFFMDYLAMGRLDPAQAAAIVRGVAGACQEAGCTLLGGETAEMPDVYLPGTFDLAGTIVGVVDAATRIAGRDIRAGDILLGLPSSGLHTNGYSLVRRIVAPYEFDTVLPELGEPLVDALLRPHRCYLREIQALREHAGISIKGMVHITGGGFEGNIVRILPAGLRAVIEANAWSVPPLFRLLASTGSVSQEEMYRTFNMGVGMVLVVSPETATLVRRVLPEILTVGYITEGEGVTVHYP